MWVRERTQLSDVDAVAIAAAVGMFLFSFAPTYVTVPVSTGGGPGPAELFGGGQSINAWQHTTSGAPVVLVLLVAILLTTRRWMPIPTIVLRAGTRMLLLAADLVFGFALFDPDDATFEGAHHGWGIWASLACLAIVSLLAMSSPTPPRPHVHRLTCVQRCSLRWTADLGPPGGLSTTVSMGP